MGELFLTDARQKVLEGNSDWEDSSITVEKFRIRNRSRSALQELIEVAQSPEIDNEKVFEAEDVGTLIGALLGHGLVTASPEYRREVGSQIEKEIHLYHGIREELENVEE